MSQFQKDLIVVLASTAVVICIIIGVATIGKSKKADNSDYSARTTEAVDQYGEPDYVDAEEAVVADEDYYDNSANSSTADETVVEEVRTVNDADPNLKDYSDWVCNTRLTEADIRDLPKSELRILRNTIYARHGHIFKSADLRNHFSQFDWYVPTVSVVTDLSPIEQHNVALIQRFE